MRSLFRSFERRRVRYLVISGQASVLYGAQHFSQDLDVWIEPSKPNVARLLRALSDLRARVHKLTPRLSLRNLRRGHGFHFIVPPAIYLDVMGQPPRVGGFAGAARRGERMRTPWGPLPVVAIEDLVELKKTNRAADYDVITRLALIRLSHERAPSTRLLAWVVENVFRAEDLLDVVQRWGRLVPADDAAVRVLRRVGSPAAAGVDRAARHIARRAQRLQERGRAYWLPRIDELREWRRRGSLIPEGLPARELLR